MKNTSSINKQIIIGALIFALSCNNNELKFKIALPDPIFQKAADELQQPPITPIELKMLSVSVSKSEVSGVQVGSVYATAQGSLDYFEYQTCSVLSGQCSSSQRSTFPRFFLTPQPAGEIEVKVRPCADTNRIQNMSSTNCGSWESRSFNQPENSDGKIELLRSREELNEQLGSLAHETKEAFDVFQKESESCLSNAKEREKILAIRGGVQLGSAVSESLLVAAFKKPNISKVTNTTDSQNETCSIQNQPQSGAHQCPEQSDKTVSQAKTQKPSPEAVSKLSDNLAATDDYKTIGTQMKSGMSTYKAAQPLPGIAMLSTSIMDIFTARSQIKTSCLAQQTAANTFAAINQHKIDLENQIYIIDKKLSTWSSP